MAQTRIDRAWFSTQLRQRGTTQRALAAHMGIDTSAVSLLLNGKRRLQLPQAQEIADFLGLDVAEVLSHAGVRIAARAGAPAPIPQVRLVGTVNAQAAVRLDATPATIDAHVSMPADAVAVRAQTAGSPLDVMDGWLIIFQPSRAAAPELSGGRLSVVELRDGRRFLAIVRRGYADGTHNLLLPSGALLENLHVASAAPVLWIRP